MIQDMVFISGEGAFCTDYTASVGVLLNTLRLCCEPFPETGGVTHAHKVGILVVKVCVRGLKFFVGNALLFGLYLSGNFCSLQITSGLLNLLDFWIVLTTPVVGGVDNRVFFLKLLNPVLSVSRLWAFLDAGRAQSKRTFFVRWVDVRVERESDQILGR